MGKHGRIHLLSESIQKKIAAGEVIEGPHSVVKELIENSLDASATRILLAVEEGGLKHIRVQDDGEGIDPEDLALSIIEHATSKINSIDDIHQVLSYGFRGEALSSIASVSKMIIESRPQSLKNGAKMTEDGSIAPFAGRAGTTVQVSQLFYNTPARKKFMKSKASESRKIRDVLIKNAIVHPEVHFEYESDGKQKSLFPACMSREERLNQIFGSQFSSSLYFDTVKDMGTEISGFISKPGYYRKNRQMQFFFVNGRPVEHRPLSFHLNRAYDALLPYGEHPAAFIFLSIDPELVDVNVHPAKKEIRLFDSSYIDSLIHGFARKILDTTEHHIRVPLPREKEDDEEVLPVLPLEQRQISQSYVPSPKHESFHIEEERKNDIQVDSEDSANRTPATALSDISILGVVYETYLLVYHDDTFKIIDFHAAHERILYDLLMEKQEYESQMLVFPEEYAVTEFSRSAVEEYLDALKEHGFDVDFISEDSLIIRSVPAYLNRQAIADFLDDFFTTATENRTLVDELHEIICAKAACHSAKRSGDVLSPGDMRLLAEKIFSGRHELRCPHGRPVLLVLSRQDMERFFRR